MTIEQTIATHYTPGLHFWTRRLDDYVSVICQNPLGAVEYRIHTDGHGVSVIHSPSLIHGWAETRFTGCPVQGGECFEGHSGHAFQELIQPLLDSGRFSRVLDKMAEIHTDYFRTGVAA